MLDYLAVFQSENVHDRHAAVARFPNKMTVHDHQVTFRHESLEIKPQRWKGLDESANERNEWVRTISCRRIVLPVVGPYVFGDSFFRLKAKL